MWIALPPVMTATSVVAHATGNIVGTCVWAYLSRIAIYNDNLNKSATMESMDIDQKIENLSKEISQLRQDLNDKTHQITLTMVGVIISIWAVTLITASTLYIVTH